MKKEDIIPWDWQRILMGSQSYDFLLEVLFRTLIIYFLFLVTVRLLGKRLDGQITLTDMAVMILFGAVISSPMQMYERGILVGVIALGCILIFDRGINFLSVKNERIDALSQGRSSTLLIDGIMQLRNMSNAGISKQNLFAVLRQRNIYNLGRVKRVYFEACGTFSVYENTKARPGLAIMPSDRLDLVKYTQGSSGSRVCRNCGYVTNDGDEQSPCANCRSVDWMEATMDEA